MVEKEHKGLSMQRQCDLLSIHRSGLNYHSKKTSKLNLKLMRLIDQKNLIKPYYGVYCSMVLTDIQVRTPMGNPKLRHSTRQDTPHRTP